LPNRKNHKSFGSARISLENCFQRRQVSGGLRLRLEIKDKKVNFFSISASNHEASVEWKVLKWALIFMFSAGQK
jgi:hypothetical protein